MPRRTRFPCGGYVYHALNRAVGRAALFDKLLGYAAFEKVLRQAHDQVPMRLLAYCLIKHQPNTRRGIRAVACSARRTKAA